MSNLTCPTFYSSTSSNNVINYGRKEQTNPELLNILVCVKIALTGHARREHWTLIPSVHADGTLVVCVKCGKIQQCLIAV